MSAQHILIKNENAGKIGSNNYQGIPVKETLTNGYFIVDKKWTVKYWNKAAEKLLGVNSEDIIGKNLWDIFAGSLPIEFYSVYHKAFLQEEPIHFREYWAEKGAWFEVITWYCDNSLCVSFKSSNEPYTQTTELRLRTLTELYKFVAEITNHCLWEWDLKTKEIFWMDGGHKKMLGYPIENMIVPESFWECCLHPDDKIRLLTKLNRILVEGKDIFWEDEYRFKNSTGDYLYVHDRGHIIYDGNNNATRIIGATQDISERIFLENKLSKERISRQRQITEAVLTAHENERADIGKELHDNLGQILAVAKMYMQMAESSEENRQACINKSLGYIVNVMDEIRKISKTLVIPATNIIGLFDNIKNLLKDLSIIHPLKLEFHLQNIGEEDLHEKLQLTIFRIVQEQINNILRHSKASFASINLSRQDNNVVLLISDNGIGYNINEKKSGVGLINIMSRAELNHGNVVIVSLPGKGYTLKVVLPLNIV